MNVVSARSVATRNIPSVRAVANPISHVGFLIRGSESTTPRNCSSFVSSKAGHDSKSLCLYSVNDVEVLGNRLGKIEEALLRCLSAVERSKTPSNAATRQSLVIQSDDSHNDPNDSQHMDGNSFIDSSSETRPKQCNGHAFPGSTPIASLYTEAQAACDRLRSSLLFLNPDSQYSPSLDFRPDQICSLQSRLKEASELFETLSRESPFLPIPESDGLLPSLPPRALLEACLETYFTCHILRASVPFCPSTTDKVSRQQSKSNTDR
jgi:hypothetical protein